MTNKQKIKELIQEMRLKGDEHNDSFLHGCVQRLQEIASTMDGDEEETEDDSGGNPPGGGRPGTPGHP